MKGKLYLIPTTLGTSNANDVLPLRVREIINHCNYYIVENQKNTRQFIKQICPEKSQSELHFFVLDKHNSEQNWNEFLMPIEQGFSMGIISDAGCPAIADPGADIVAIAHSKGIEIEPLVGPSSIILAMMGSGFNGQSFAFNGYLPIDKFERKQMLKKLEKKVQNENQTQIFIETPYRNHSLLEDMLQILSPQTKICIACEVTLPSAYIKTMSVQQWKKQEISLHKRPTIFVIGN